MKRYVGRKLVALAAPPAAGAMFMASPATAAVAITAAPAAALRCHASMSNSRPKDYTTIYVNVGTIRYVGVTTVAHYKTVNRKHTVRMAKRPGSGRFSAVVDWAEWHNNDRSRTPSAGAAFPQEPGVTHAVSAAWSRCQGLPVQLRAMKIDYGRVFEQDLADYVRVLGEDHPGTLTARGNLASA